MAMGGGGGEARGVWRRRGLAGLLSTFGNDEEQCMSSSYFQKGLRGRVVAFVNINQQLEIPQSSEEYSVLDEYLRRCRGAEELGMRPGGGGTWNVCTLYRSACNSKPLRQ